MVHWWIINVCFVQVTILNIIWRSRCADVPWCAHFPNYISWVIQEGVKWIEKCAHRGASARWERLTMFKIVTWTKQTCTKYHNTRGTRLIYFGGNKFCVLICTCEGWKCSSSCRCAWIAIGPPGRRRDGCAPAGPAPCETSPRAAQRNQLTSRRSAPPFAEICKQLLTGNIPPVSQIEFRGVESLATVPLKSLIHSQGLFPSLFKIFYVLYH